MFSLFVIVHLELFLFCDEITAPYIVIIMIIIIMNLSYKISLVYLTLVVGLLLLACNNVRWYCCILDMYFRALHFFSANILSQQLFFLSRILFFLIWCSGLKSRDLFLNQSCSNFYHQICIWCNLNELLAIHWLMLINVMICSPDT